MSRDTLLTRESRTILFGEAFSEIYLPDATGIAVPDDVDGVLSEVDLRSLTFGDVAFAFSPNNSLTATVELQGLDGQWATAGDSGYNFVPNDAGNSCCASNVAQSFLLAPYGNSAPYPVVNGSRLRLHVYVYLDTYLLPAVLEWGLIGVARGWDKGGTRVLVEGSLSGTDNVEFDMGTALYGCVMVKLTGAGPADIWLEVQDPSGSWNVASLPLAFPGPRYPDTLHLAVDHHGVIPFGPDLNLIPSQQMRLQSNAPGGASLGYSIRTADFGRESGQLPNSVSFPAHNASSLGPPPLQSNVYSFTNVSPTNAGAGDPVQINTFQIPGDYYPSSGATVRGQMVGSFTCSPVLSGDRINFGFPSVIIVDMARYAALASIDQPNIEVYGFNPLTSPVPGVVIGMAQRQWTGILGPGISTWSQTVGLVFTLGTGGSTPTLPMRPGKDYGVFLGTRITGNSIYYGNYDRGSTSTSTYTSITFGFAC